MKVTVEGLDNIYTVRVAQGNQRFKLDYEGPRDECLWYARMFRKALKAHDKEQAKKTTCHWCQNNILEE